MIETIRVLGLDAAFANTGIVLAEYHIATNTVDVKELRVVQTTSDKSGKRVVRKNSDDLRRASEQLRALDKAIADHNPSFAFCEVPFGAQSARAAWALGISVGLIAHVETRVPLIQVTPKEVKDVVGEKFPDKAQMIAWAVKTYPNANWPRARSGGLLKVVAGKAEHMADACATIHAGIATPEFQRVVAMSKLM